MTEKELMLTSILDCRRVDLYVGDWNLNLSQENQFDRMQERRRKGEPLQYILGRCDFFGFPLTVDYRVFIPRPETELLAEAVIGAAFSMTCGKKQDLRILDIGTGSGNIAISLAKNIPQCYVTAMDISPGALALARENASELGMAHKIHFLNTCFIDFLKSSDPQKNLSSCCEDRRIPSNESQHQDQRLAYQEPFDIIVSNPPYIARSQIDHLPLDVRHEPRSALDGGHDGLDFYRFIIAGIGKDKGHLKEGGFLFLEIGDGQRPALEDIFSQFLGYSSVCFQKDYSGTDRIVVARWGSCE